MWKTISWRLICRTCSEKCFIGTWFCESVLTVKSSIFTHKSLSCSSEKLVPFDLTKSKTKITKRQRWSMETMAQLKLTNQRLISMKDLIDTLFWMLATVRSSDPHNYRKFLQTCSRTHLLYVSSTVFLGEVSVLK